VEGGKTKAHRVDELAFFGMYFWLLAFPYMEFANC